MPSWLLDESPVCANIVQQLLDLGLPKVLAECVARMQDLSLHEVSNFISKSSDYLHDPFLIQGMREAVKVASDHIENQSAVMVFGDFDVDGVSGASILYWGLRKAGMKNFPEVYIPNRFSEGHGLNLNAIERFAEQGINLVITADCGMGNDQEVEHARKYGIDVIITDHHMGENERLKAAAVVNPRLGDYPFEHLSGAGVAYKFIEALLLKRYGKESEQYKSTMENCIDYVAIGTVADVMPLIGENRVLVDRGLKNMVKSKLPFLSHYWSKNLRKIELNEPFTTEHIGFQMAPRINAASRLETGRHAFDFLTSVKPEEVIRRGRYLDFLNTERKSRLAQLKSSENLTKYYVQKNRVLIVNSNSPEKGLLGLLASHFLEEEKSLQAVLVLGDDPSGELSGSARASRGFDWFICLKLLENHLMRFGGHAEAAGCLLKRTNLHQFVEDFNDLELIFNQSSLVRRYNASIALHEITSDFVLWMENLGPYGERFRRPIFKLDQFKVSSSRCVGPEGRDLSFMLSGDTDTRVSGIGFRMGSRQLELEKSKELIVELGFNYFRKREIQLRLIDCISSSEVTQNQMNSGNER